MRTRVGEPNAVDSRTMHSHDEPDFGQTVAVGRMVTANGLMGVGRRKLGSRDHWLFSGVRSRNALQRKVGEFASGRSAHAD